MVLAWDAASINRLMWTYRVTRADELGRVDVDLFGGAELAAESIFVGVGVGSKSHVALHVRHIIDVTAMSSRGASVLLMGMVERVTMRQLKKGGGFVKSLLSLGRF